MTTRRSFLQGTGAIVLYFNMVPVSVVAQQASAGGLSINILFYCNFGRVAQATQAGL